MVVSAHLGRESNPEPRVFFQDGANDPCQQFTGELAEEYCQLAGGHAVSLDSNEKVTDKTLVGDSLVAGL